MADDSLLSNVGWNASVPPNGFFNRPKEANNNDNPLGLSSVSADIEIETTPEHMNLVAGDPFCQGWTRSYDDPNVIALREHLRSNNGIKGLQVVSPDDVKLAAALLHRDGFVVVRDVLSPSQLKQIQQGSIKAVADLMEDDPTAAAGGGAGGLPHRYSFGGGSASRQMLHLQQWCDLIDLSTTTPILTEIFGSANYVVGGAGGDIALPGAIEYQGLHSDNMWSELPDPFGHINMRDLPVPVLTINFPMIDLNFENGPIRQIPGSQRWRAPIPALVDEPDWMKLSTVCPAPAGCAILRDIRAWHGGTPNLSKDVRAMPNVEYYAPWFRSEGIMRCMPYERWQGLSSHAQRISRYVVCDKDEDVIGAGYMHPKSRMREKFKEEQFEKMGERRAQEYRNRL